MLLVINYLLSFESLNINETTSRGTALHLACNMGKTQIIQLLLDKQA